MLSTASEQRCFIYNIEVFTAAHHSAVYHQPNIYARSIFINARSIESSYGLADVENERTEIGDPANVMRIGAEIVDRSQPFQSSSLRI
jgi:hypothetical protein